jgi:hypothetical protein
MASSPDDTPAVLVLGAGELGMSVLKSFTARGSLAAHVSVLLRPATIDSKDRGKQRDVQVIREWGIRIVPGDISSASVTELATLVAPFDLVISCTGFSAGRGTQVKIVKAVLSARVKKFIPWQFGVDYDRIGMGSTQELFDEQLQVREMLRSQPSSSTQWKIISTGIFCSFLFEPWFGVVEPMVSGEIVVRALGSWENAVTVTTAEDIGALTVAVVLSPTTGWNSITFVAGDTITYGALASLVREAAPSRQVQTEEWTVEVLRQRLAEDAADAVSQYRVVFAEGVGVSWDVECTWNAIHGIRTTSVREWLKTHSEALAMRSTLKN